MNNASGAAGQSSPDLGSLYFRINSLLNSLALVYDGRRGDTVWFRRVVSGPLLTAPELNKLADDIIERLRASSDPQVQEVLNGAKSIGIE
jgi:hypothetical protein